MNKAFTLVELLAVLFILGVMTVVAVPNVITTNQKSRKNDIEEFKKTVENAAEVYVETNLKLKEVQDLKNNGFQLCITKDKLLPNVNKAGLLNPKLKNPENGIEIEKNEIQFSVLAQKQENEIIYTYHQNNNCT